MEDGFFGLDQLNTHKSESLVRQVAQRCGIQTDLRVKQQRIRYSRLYGNSCCFFV